jgi:hypothetical protein
MREGIESVHEPICEGNGRYPVRSFPKSVPFASCGSSLESDVRERLLDGPGSEGFLKPRFANTRWRSAVPARPDVLAWMLYPRNQLGQGNDMEDG